jgi:hypothetical protein
VALLAGSAAAGGIAAVLLVGWLAVWWERHEIDSLSEQKIELQNDVAELQASVAVLEKKGGRIKLRGCGGRLCIESNSDQGEGAEKLAASNWSDEETGVSLVIPKGY